MNIRRVPARVRSSRENGGGMGMRNNIKIRKTLIATACITATVITALATSTKAEEDTVAFCKSIGETARLIMLTRQANLPMSTQMEIIDKMKASDTWKSLARKMIISAYQKPGFSTEKGRDVAVADFGNEAELVCYQQAS